MKISKITGAFFAVLLVSALLTGTAAADSENKYLGTVYTYGLYNDSKLGDIDLSENLIWTDVYGNTISFLPEGDGSNYYIKSTDVVAEGDYSRGIGDTMYHIDVRFPDAIISGSVYKTSNPASLLDALIDSTVPNDRFISFNDLTDSNILRTFTSPDKKLSARDFTEFGAKNVSTTPQPIYDISGLMSGTWTVQATFVKSLGLYFDGKYVISQYAPGIMYGKPYTFTIVSSEDAKKLISKDESVIQSGYATVILTAPPEKYNISIEHGRVPKGQALASQPPGYLDNRYLVTVPSGGAASFSVESTDSSDIIINLYEDSSYSVITKTLIIPVIPGTITVDTVIDSLYIGNELELKGTNDFGETLYFFIKGTNYPLQTVKNAAGKNVTASGKEWKVTIPTITLKKDDAKLIDAGVYTIYAVSNISDVSAITEIKDLGNPEKVKSYATISVALKQPSIAITKAPDVAIQGDSIEVKGTAEGNPVSVQYYLFGTNYFDFGTIPVVENSFTLRIPKTNTTSDKMAAGQYFLVIQHQMYDKKFNIGADKDSRDVILNTTGKWDEGGSVLFNVNDRQSANAAQALCDALDSQNIDDMYAKMSFVLSESTSVINPIPSQITIGEMLTVSGTAAGHKNDMVSVELLSTAFAAQPKEDVSSASYITLSTRIDETGKWSVSFDTSYINPDEYTCSVSVGELDAAASKISVIDGYVPKPEETKEVPLPKTVPVENPAEHTSTPGFGVITMISCLGAAAMLLRKK